MAVLAFGGEHWLAMRQTLSQGGSLAWKSLMSGENELEEQAKETQSMNKCPVYSLRLSTGISTLKNRNLFG